MRANRLPREGKSKQVKKGELSNDKTKVGSAFPKSMSGADEERHKILRIQGVIQYEGNVLDAFKKLWSLKGA